MELKLLRSAFLLISRDVAYIRTFFWPEIIPTLQLFNYLRKSTKCPSSRTLICICRTLACLTFFTTVMHASSDSQVSLMFHCFGAGKVNISLSGPVKFSPKVAKLTKNEITVRLMDSYSNPVLLQQSKLKLEIGSVNRSGFSTWTFIDNKDGTYNGSYMAKDVGTYELCASFDGMRFMPCPFGVNVYTSEFFSLKHKMKFF